MVDLVLGIGFLGAGASGYKRGAMRDVQGLLGIVLGLLVAKAFSGVALSYVVSYISSKTGYGQYIKMIAPYALNTIIFLLIFRIVRTLTRSILNLSDLPKPFKTADSLAGVFVGLLKYIVIIWLILILIGTVPLSANLSSLLAESEILAKLGSYNMLTTLVPSFDAIQRSVQTLTF